MLGAMLAGIVFMQVELLKLNSSIGHGIDRGATLQSQNEQLRASVAALADDQRIEGLAASEGMVMPSPDNVVFVSPQGTADVQNAVGKMRTPDASALATAQADQQSATQTAGSQASASSPPASSSTASSSGTLGVSMPSSSSATLAASTQSQSGSSTATGN